MAITNGWHPEQRTITRRCDKGHEWHVLQEKVGRHIWVDVDPLDENCQMCEAGDLAEAGLVEIGSDHDPLADLVAGLDPMPTVEEIEAEEKAETARLLS